MSIDQIRNFLDDLADMKVFYVNVGGGEPLLHPDFFAIMDYASAKGLYVQFSTNGTLVNESVAGAVTERRLRVQVSLDGWDKGSNDPIRGSGTFEKALRAVKLLREKGAIVSVNCVATQSTFAGLDRLYDLVTDFGARLRLSRLRPSGRASRQWQNLAPSVEQYKYLYRWLLQHPAVATGDSFFFLSALGEQPLPGLSDCGAGKLACSVDPEGNVYPCPFTIDPSLLVGNVKDKPLSVLWQESGLFAGMRTTIPATCTACPSYSQCRGGCRGASYLVYGDWNQPDPECMRRENNGQVSVY